MGNSNKKLNLSTLREKAFSYKEKHTNCGYVESYLNILNTEIISQEDDFISEYLLTSFDNYNLMKWLSVEKLNTLCNSLKTLKHRNNRRIIVGELYENFPLKLTSSPETFAKIMEYLEINEENFLMEFININGVIRLYNPDIIKNPEVDIAIDDYFRSKARVRK